MGAVCRLMIFSHHMGKKLPTRRQLLNAAGIVATLLLVAVGSYFLWRKSPREDRLFEFIVALGVVGTLAFAALVPLSVPWRFLVGRLTWREAEYQRLSHLFAGMSIHKLEETLGSALFQSLSKDGLLRESVFRGRGYWVQAIYDPTGTVKFLAVTSTSLNFRPQYQTPLGTVTLLATRFDAIPSKPIRIRYFTRGATAPSYYFDDYSGGNPTLYKMYTFGINEVGAFRSTYLAGMNRISPFMSSSYTNRQFPDRDREVGAFREGSVINTYGETDVSFHLDVVLKDFCIGPDQIRVRTVR
jgi:hypothetical protein